jgi:hypothetical protein
MKQNSLWVADSRLASQEVPGLLLNPKVHYLVHKNPPPAPIPSTPLHGYNAGFGRVIIPSDFFIIERDELRCARNIFEQQKRKKKLTWNKVTSKEEALRGMNLLCAARIWFVSGREHSQVTGKVIDHTIKVLNTHVCMFFSALLQMKWGERKTRGISEPAI